MNFLKELLSDTIFSKSEFHRVLSDNGILITLFIYLFYAIFLILLLPFIPFLASFSDMYVSIPISLFAVTSYSSQSVIMCLTGISCFPCSYLLYCCCVVCNFFAIWFCDHPFSFLIFVMLFDTSISLKLPPIGFDNFTLML